MQWNVDYPNVNHLKCRIYESLTWPDRSRDAYDWWCMQAQAVLATSCAILILN